MAKHMTCYKDPKGEYLKKLKVSAAKGDFFGGMKNYRNMTEFENRYANVGEPTEHEVDWALFWIKCYLGKDKKKKKKVYLAEYEKEHKSWVTRRHDQAKLGHVPYMITGVIGGHSDDDPPKVYLYEGYEGEQSKCLLWVFTP